MGFRAEDVHPMRFLRAVPGSDRIVQQAVRSDPQGLLSSATLDLVTGHVVELYNAGLGLIAFEQRPSTMDAVNKTVSTLAHIANFASAGRNSFLLPREVTALLGRTDLGDIRLSDIRLPFRAFYLGFAGGLAVGLPGLPNVIDGAYVETFKIEDDAAPHRYLTFYVTARRTDGATGAKSAWITSPEPHFYAQLKILAAAEDTLEAAIERATRSGDIALEAEPEAQAALIDGIRQATEEGFLVEKPVTTGYERAAAFNLAALPTMRSVLALLCNAICLLSAEPVASEPGWPTDAPQSLVDIASRGSTLKRRRTATGQLAERGFFSTRTITLQLNAPDAAEAQANLTMPSGRELLPHWRRGHWRRQPHGAGNLERRLIWIRPVLVRRDRGEDVEGHVYVISN
ncbi:hypothetical protein [Aminobacter sp. Piv2-1]|uniref:hypothetical protein n=1 Tax=Aminobacter sp. Piv2-1 TaxID=3031122 RepID=UPI00309BAEFF